jgi:3-deoxy-manno-octulosonate cytidylyltransferase (CMP-KDO synthetase)
MNPIIAIPARLASTRLPGKPLAEIGGAPMIVQVWRRAVEAGAGPVVVACAEATVAEAVTRAGGRAVLTRPEHPSGSDRIREAVEAIDPQRRHDLVVNVQGDLPMLDPRLVRAVLEPFDEAAVDIATVACVIRDEADRSNPNVVKLVAAFPADLPGARARALYFSRATVPSGLGPHYHHIGLYAYRRAALDRFVILPRGVLEQRERLEQLRALEAGMRISVGLIDPAWLGVQVDTPADLARAREVMGN